MVGFSVRGALKAGSVTIALSALAMIVQAQAWSPDAGPGFFRNPIIFADYSDPDVVRVGADYYMTASSFESVPALPILHSRDLVHWQIVNHALRRLGTDFDRPQHGNGVWAPSIRHHDGAFYIFYGDPDRGIFMVKTRNIRATWDAPVLVKAAKGWIDPCPLWDDNGNAYLVHAFANSRAGIKSVLHVNRMSPDGTRLLDEGTLVFDGHERHPTIEGPKFYKRDGWYYIFAPAGGVATGWQTVLRSRNVLGPYEDRIVLVQGSTNVNGPHQGGWVRSASGEDWFIHFQDRDAYGRVVHLQPMTWRADGWPVIGADPDGDGVGEPVATYRLPSARAGAETVPLSSDEFDAPRLGLQWQWQANDDPEWYSLSAHRGALRLFARPLPRDSANLWFAPNVVLQKFSAPSFTVTSRITLSDTGALSAGLVVLGMDYASLGLRRADGIVSVVRSQVLDAPSGRLEEVSSALAIGGRSVFVRVAVAADAMCTFAYSLDAKSWTPLGGPFQARKGRWVGAKVGLFAVGASGHADIDFFRVTSGLFPRQ